MREGWARATSAKGSHAHGHRPRGAGVLTLLLLLPAALAGLAPPAAAALPADCEVKGPDAHGYWCQPTGYTWLDTSQGTAISLSDDETSEVIVLPFVFPWYGEDKAAVYVSSNGLVCFASTNCAELNPPPMPSADTPNDIVACYWEDLNPGVEGAVVRHATLGEQPDRVFVVEFQNVPHYLSSGNNTFQIQLTEQGEARCMWATVYSDNDNVPTAVGMENATGLGGVRYAHKQFEGGGAGVRFFRCTTCTTPGAPGALATSPGPSSGQVTLTWQQPGSDGGFPVVGYNLYRGSGPGSLGLVARLGNVTRTMDCCFSAGSTWFFEVRAVNNAGEGPGSGVVQGSPPGPPSAPQAFAGVPGPGASQITLAWAQPSSDGGNPIQTFRVYRRPSGWWREELIAQPGNVTTFVDTSCSFSCLNPGTSWQYRVSAVNAFGEGSSTGTITVFAPTFPGPPENTAATRGPLAGQITLAWDPPRSSGGIPLTAYRVYGGNAPWSLSFLAQVTSAGHTDAGLAEGVLRYYRVTAVNAVGEGSPGATVAQRAPTRPSPPLNLVASGGPGPGQVTLGWAPPADLGGIPLLKYRVYRLGTGGAPVLLAEPGPGASNHTDTNASLVAVSHYVLAAVNDVGEGPGSNQACAAPAPWGAVDPPAGEPCPPPAGWTERQILAVALPLGGLQRTPPVDVDLVAVDAGPRASDPKTYDVNIRVLGQALPRISVFSNGLLQPGFHVELLHVPVLTVPLPGATLEVSVAERHDPARAACFASLGEQCLLLAPNALDAGWLAANGGDAFLILRARVRDGTGAILAEQAVALPVAGLAASLAPQGVGLPGVGLPGVGTPELPALPGVSPPALPPLPRVPRVCVDTLCAGG